MSGAFVHTFGCQMNECDSHKMEALLRAMGLGPAGRPEEAEVVVVNTCAVRRKAEDKALSLLGRLEARKRRGTVLIATGCMAQCWGERLLRRFEGLDAVLGPGSLHLLPEAVRRARQGQRLCATDFPGDPPWLHLPGPATGRRAYLTVTLGCDNFCSYCIVPYARGPERSKPPQEVLREARALREAGVEELVLLGQNVNAYGRELGTGFPELLRRVAELGFRRLRFLTSHPRDLSEELIRCFDGSVPGLCPHLHLPLQAGSDRVLRLMRRGYTLADYLRKVERLREVCPEIALSTDLIVGFPGETDLEFRRTLRAVEQIGFDSAFTFKYSDRPFALARLLPDPVPEPVKAERLRALQELQERISLRRNRRLVGRWVEVMLEGRDRRGRPLGRTRDNRVVVLPDAPGPQGVVWARVVEAHPHHLKAEMQRGEEICSGG